ncbi:MAG: hypothetical protein APF84_11475 [Gracilibacter sp. BRH_c7a]|nr:MAG: hypothetical protein APF84_11475 [Gracilibacter sp. BRH_c7a]
MNSIQKDNRFVTEWGLLLRVGALAAWVTALLIPVAIVSHMVWPPPPWAPGAVADWFVYIQGNPFAGLLNLDFALEFGLVLSIPLYLALYVVLKQNNPSMMVIATSVALLGAFMHLLSNTAIEMMMLSEAHAAATSDMQRTVYLAAGEAMLSSYYGMVFQVSYILGYIAYIIIGIVMRQGKLFSKSTANLGILTGIAGFGFYLPKIGLMLSVLVVLLIGIWNVMVGCRLFQLGKSNHG